MPRKSRCRAVVIRYSTEPHIYLLTLLKDTESFKAGSRYVGQSRGKKGRYFTGGNLPIAIIKKYGRGIFSREIIVEGDFTPEELNSMEKFYIAVYGSEARGLNLNLGGDSRRYPTYPVYRYNMDGSYAEEHRSTSEVLKLFGVDDSGLTRSLSSEGEISVGGFRFTKNKVDALNPPKGLKSIYAKTVLYKYSLNGEFIGEFKTLKEAMTSCGVAARSDKIKQALDNKDNAAFGFQWRTYQISDCGKYAPIDERNKKAARAIDSGGAIVYRFESIKEAADTLGVHASNISRACQGYIKNIKGLQWEYENGGPKDPKKVTLRCAFCGKEYEVLQTIKHSSKYCSRRCVGMPQAERFGKCGFKKNDPRLLGNTLRKGKTPWNKKQLDAELS